MCHNKPRESTKFFPVNCVYYHYHCKVFVQLCLNKHLMNHNICDRKKIPAKLQYNHIHDAEVYILQALFYFLILRQAHKETFSPCTSLFC